ncbi:MAG: dihydroorotate dehydrogenase electron transfer subunit [Pirellulaceae bacterium]|nr:dihydroorotate dehydrogenase electron transfer subunit [Pirellulaceae bacterium]
MTSPLHAPFYADSACQQNVEIVENVRLARETFRLRFRSPVIAQRILPGQFLMLRLADCNDPLIGRPLAMYDVVGDCVDVVYLTKGKLTTRLQEFRPGQRVDIWGPLGNGFLPQRAEHLVMVAGGIGQTPFLALAKEYLGQQQFGTPPRQVPKAKQVTFCYGARTADYLAGVQDFEQLGVKVQIATDDGTRGHHGLVTDLLRKVLADRRAGGVSPLILTGTRILCCGPEPMMEAVAKIAAAENIPCQVSLETPMACGIGICFSCVAKVRTAEGEWDYKRTCVEGPVFDAATIEW